MAANIKTIAEATKQKATDLQTFKIDRKDVTEGTEIIRGSTAIIKNGTRRDLKDNKTSPVIIKTMFFGGSYGSPHDPKKKKEFQRECRTLILAQSEHVVQIYGFVEDHPRMIVMEKSGESLFQVLKNQTINLDWKLRFQVIKQMAKALVTLHAREILHRDIKAENVVLPENWQVDPEFKAKLIDFGIAIEENRLEELSNDTCLFGTYPFLAPEIREVASAKRTAANLPSKKTDTYAFGIFLWQIASRKSPSLETAMNEKLEEIPGDIPEPYAMGISTLIQACWQTDPKLRPDFNTIVEFLNSAADNTCRINFFDYCHKKSSSAIAANSNPNPNLNPVKPLTFTKTITSETTTASAVPAIKDSAKSTIGKPAMISASK